MNRDPSAPPSPQANNADLLIWALYSIGGGSRWVDVEEWYLKAFEVAPARLSWRTRSDIPDYKKCAKALQELEDPKRSDHLGLVDKQGKYSRRLTSAGVQWCERFTTELGGLYGARVVPNANTQDDGRRVKAITDSPAFAVWNRTKELTAPIWELAELLSCLPDSPKFTWTARLDEHLFAARRNGRSDIEAFLIAAKERINTEL